MVVFIYSLVARPLHLSAGKGSITSTRAGDRPFTSAEVEGSGHETSVYRDGLADCLLYKVAKQQVIATCMLILLYTACCLRTAI